MYYDKREKNRCEFEAKMKSVTVTMKKGHKTKQRKSHTAINNNTVKDTKCYAAIAVLCRRSMYVIYWKVEILCFIGNSISLICFFFVVRLFLLDFILKSVSWLLSPYVKCTIYKLLATFVVSKRRARAKIYNICVFLTCWPYSSWVTEWEFHRKQEIYLSHNGW